MHLAIWSIYTSLLFPVIRSNLGALGSELVSEAVKLVLWTMPAIVFVRHYSSDMFLTLREMLTARFKPLPYLLLSSGVLVYSLATSIFINGKITLNLPNPLSPLIGTVLLVGITEEVLFRGFFMNALLRKTKAAFAVIISSLLFLVIHFPWWIYNGKFSDPLSALVDCVAVFALGLIFGWTFLKSRNIFVSIFVHMLWNLLLTLFVV